MMPSELCDERRDQGRLVASIYHDSEAAGIMSPRPGGRGLHASLGPYQSQVSAAPAARKCQCNEFQTWLHGTLRF